MVSPPLEKVTPINLLVRRIRRPETVVRSRARHDCNLWLFGQVHVKDLLLFTHIAFMVISIWLMWQVGVADFTGLQVPGLDGFSPFDIHHQYGLDQGQERESIYVSTSPNIEKPYLYFSRNVSSILCYFFFFSALIGFVVLMTIHGVWQRNTLTSLLCCINPAFFLTPLFLCVVTMGGGLLLCCIRSVRIQIHQISERETDQTVAVLIFDAIRFTFIPCILMWIVYLYYVYGCVLSFLYVYRHSSDWSSLKRDTVGINKTGWSFKDRRSSMTKQLDYANTKSEVVSRSSAVDIGLHSPEVIDSPLKGYTKKVDGDCSSSLINSEYSGSEINISFGSDMCYENNNMNPSFSFNASRRLLETVHEESESQENTFSSETSFIEDIHTRM